MADSLSSFLPLSPATLHILLALAGEDRHGYGIMQEVARQSQGTYKLGTGTLYDNLQKLMDQGFVGEAQGPVTATEAKRRNYRLTAAGRQLLATEVSRLEEVVAEARLHLRKPNWEQAT